MWPPTWCVRVCVCVCVCACVCVCWGEDHVAGVPEAEGASF